jgi:hypothetical protein
VRPLRPRHPETARQSLKDGCPGVFPEARCRHPTRRYAANLFRNCLTIASLAAAPEAAGVRV